MQKILHTATLIFTTTCLFMPLYAYAAKQDPNATVVTINNQNTTEVYANIRNVNAPRGDNCLPEMKLFPGDARIIKYGELLPKCQNDTKFLIDAYGKTHTIVHTALLNKTPGYCLIEHSGLTIKITCSS